MRFESRTWFILSLLLFAAAIYFWKRGNEYQIQKMKALPPAQQKNAGSPGAAARPVNPATMLGQVSAIRAALGPSSPTPNPTANPAPVPAPSTTNGAPHRLSNSPKGIRELSRMETAVLLRNAFIDTAIGTTLPIPAHLQAEGEPGTYIVQARGPIRQSFRDRLQQAGAEIVAYIPNNAYLVQMNAESARTLALAPDTQAVLAYQPYYKLETKLLGLAVEQKPLGEGQWLRVTAFPGQKEALAAGLTALGGEILAEDRTPFGEQLVVKPLTDSLPAIAALPAAQIVEPFRERELLVDQTRVRLGLAMTGSATTNYLNLTGSNILVNVNDSGVDSTHPDLAGRVLGDTPRVLTDPFSHGTHIAGILAGNGSQSTSVSETPPGSDPGANFRGIAPRAQIFALPFTAFPEVNRPLNDSYLQETAARTNATMSRRRQAPMVSNNSWGYVGANEYDSSSARFDAAVRDALPEELLTQPMIYVFSAGNSGDGTDDGRGGQTDTIPSPGNAKNVITVGAAESLRVLTNGVVSTNVDGSLSTNSIFLGMTDSLSEIAAFSSRGNVGIGSEGEFGRFKPDLVAPGSFMIGTRSKDWKLEDQIDTNSPQYAILREVNEPLGPYYRYESGTSQSAPVVSGVLALMQEFFEQRLPPQLRRTNSPALMKALLINGARSLGPLYNLQVQNPGNLQGWGLVNVTNTMPSILSAGPETRWPIRMFDQNATNSLATGQSRSWRVSVSTNAELLPLRVTLVWTDPPGNPTAAIKLVNDLDLVVSNVVSGEVWYGNDIREDSDFNHTSFPDEEPVSDVVNNVENVFIREPASTNLIVTVTAKRINVAAQPEFNRATGRFNDVVQDFALVIATGDTSVTNAFTVTPIAPPPALEVQATPMTNGVPLMNERVGANSSLSSSPNGVTNQWRFYVFTNLFITNDISTMTNGTNVAFVTFLPPNVGEPRLISSDIDLYVSHDPGLVTLNPAVVDAAWKSVSRAGTEFVVFTNANLGDVFYIGVKSEDQQGGEYGLVALSSDVPFEENVNGMRVLHGMPVPQNIPDGSPANPGRATVIAIGISPVVVQRVVVTNVLTHENVGDLSISLTHEQSSVVLHNHTANNGQATVTNWFFIYDDQAFGSIPGTRRSDGPGSLNDFAGTSGSGVWLLNAVDNAPGQTGRVESVTLEIHPFQQDDLAAAGAAGIDGTVPGNGFACYFLDVPPEATNMVVNVTRSDGPLEIFISHGSLPTPEFFDKSALLPTGGGMITLGSEDTPPLGAGRYFICLHNPGPAEVRFHIAVIFELGVGLDFRRILTGTNTVPIIDGGVIRATVNVPVDKAVADAQVSVLIQHPRSADLVLRLISPQGTRLLLAENRGGPNSRGYGAAIGTNTTYTVFSEDTNQFPEIAPIKFSLPPWTSPTTSTNPPTFSESFENAVPGTYTTGQVFSGWTVIQGSALVHGLANALGVQAEAGTNFVELDTTRSPASIVTSFGTVPGRTYALNFFYHRNPGAPVRAAHALGVYYGPPRTPRSFLKFIDVPHYGWESTNIIFTATTATTDLELGSLTAAGPLLDEITIGDVVVATNAYVMPEEPIARLRGERALGEWTLEVEDTRLGPGGGGALLGWELQLEYGNPPERAAALTNGVTVSGLVSGRATNYFAVDVCESARVAFATLVGPYSRLRLLIDREGFPTGNAGLDDFFPLTNNLAVSDALDTGVAAFRLDSDPHQPAPLQPGKRLFFAVQNINPDETNTFDLQVSFDNDTCTGERPVIRLENDVPYTNVVAPSASLFDYYVFNVSPTAIGAEFEVRPRNGDVGMVLSYGLPLPDLSTFDYKSDMPGITNELVVLTNSSIPVALQPGDWYLGVYNNSTNAVVYDVRASEVLDTNLNVVLLTNNVPLDYFIFQGSKLTNFFLFKVPLPYPGVKFELYDLNANADLLISYNALPTTNSYMLSNSASPSQPITIEIRTNSALRLPDLRGNWVLAVIPREPTNLVFTLRASYILPSTNQPPPGGTNRVFDPVISVAGTNLCFSWDTTVGLQYELQGIRTFTETNWTTIFGPVTATNTTMSFCTPLPSEFAFFRVLERGTGEPPPPPETIIDPALSFTTNELCLAWTAKIGAIYQVQGKILLSENSWTNLVAPFVATTTNASFCLTLPTPYRFFQVLESTGATNPPPPPPPGSIIDPSLTFTTNTLCLGWPSKIGSTYQVQGKIALSESSWTNLVAAFVATTTNSSYCLTLPTPYQYFQVLENAGATNPPPPQPGALIDPALSFGTNGLCLSWASQSGAQYDVQGKIGVADRAWTNLASVTATGALTTHCLPTNTPYHYFQIAGRTNSTAPTGADAGTLHEPVVLGNGAIQFVLEADPGASYEVQFTTNLRPVIQWVTLTNVTPTGTSVTITDSTRLGSDTLRFYRVVRR